MRVQVEGREFVFDAGSGLRSYGQRLVESRDETPPRVAMFLSHAHLDHLIGLPYFAPLHDPEASIRIWGPRTPHVDSFAEVVEHFIHPPYFPVPFYEFPADIELVTIAESEVVSFSTDDGSSEMHHQSRVDEAELDLSIHTLRGYNHPTSGVHHYKMVYGDRSIVYATDTEAYRQGDRRLKSFAEGADVLIHDAMYTEDEYAAHPVPTQGFGHSTVRAAAELAEMAEVERLVLFHHAPSRTDEELEAIEELGGAHFEATTVARDGMTIEV